MHKYITVLISLIALVASGLAAYLGWLNSAHQKQVHASPSILYDTKQALKRHTEEASERAEQDEAYRLAQDTELSKLKQQVIQLEEIACRELISELNVSLGWTPESTLEDEALVPMRATQSITELVNEPLVRAAASTRIPQEGTIIQDLSGIAENLLYQQIIEGESITEGQSWATKNQVAFIARENAREHLRDPVRLWETYIALKPLLTEPLQGTPLGIQLANELEAGLPYFEEPLDPVMGGKEPRLFLAAKLSGETSYNFTRLQYQALHHPNEPCIEPLRRRWQASNAELEEVLGANPYLLQWALRRKNEGGDELRHTWGKVIRDFIETISPPASEDANATP